MPDLDFAGFDAAVQAAFKPHFEQVWARARRRRRTRIAAVVVAAAVVATGSGIAVAARPAGERSPAPAFGPDRTPEFMPGPQPTPTPGVGRQVSTGRPAAGDLDHLYLRYKECRTGCPVRFAATDDRGRTWRTGGLPVPDDAMVDLRAVGPRTLAAWYFSRSAPDRRSAWTTSTDGGTTWRQVTVRRVAALPAGWRVLDQVPGPDVEPLLAVDPTTGEIAQLTKRSTLLNAAYVAGLPDAAGLWVSGWTGSRDGKGGPTVWTGSAVEVSRDGGRSWQRHEFPDHLTATDDVGAAAIATYDGRTVYAVGRVTGRLVIWRSADGGGTWQRAAGTADVGDRTLRAAVRPDGVLLIQAGISAAEKPVMLASADGGRSVRPTTLGPGADARPVPGGYVQTGWPDSKGAWLSADGRTWSWVAPPEL
ncbi:hypothetical protein EV384_4269 [Micromonospora kangleipakensis]|uniref:BNR repeat protein n=1 Tax=Micromonospora kangleipakensis TaxID=1077942 RepID=A0A4Q8BEY2_9ACTN|nr:sialidase family protein [Micromonospora kangleipakensis]RZU75709.1 hypothetical protein EV384_4269 [Micromonospora kangleipakensis]